MKPRRTSLPHRLALLALALPLAAHAAGVPSAKFLVGTWQSGSPVTSDARADCWRFFADGHFAFEPTRYDNSSRLVAVRGRWRSVGRGMAVHVTSRVERVGGTIAWDPNSSNGRALAGAHEVEGKQSGGDDGDVELASCAASQGADCVQVAGTKFYRLPRDRKAE